MAIPLAPYVMLGRAGAEDMVPTPATVVRPWPLQLVEPIGQNFAIAHAMLQHTDAADVPCDLRAPASHDLRWAFGDQRAPVVRSRRTYGDERRGSV